MLPFLSDAWLAALDDAARSDQHLRETTAGLELVVEQRITGTEVGDSSADAASGSGEVPAGPGDVSPGSGEVVYHVTIDDGTVRITPGPADSPDIRFTQDHDTATGIASGRVSAQRAFMTGRLQVGGDLQLLVEQADVLAALTDVFAQVRADTTGIATPARTTPDPGTPSPS